MAKQCPLWVIAFATSKIDTVPCNLLRPLNDGSGSREADCKESYCQMWNEATKDCGLKPIQANQSSLPQTDSKKQYTIPEMFKRNPVDAPPPASEPE
ncbi:MAG TPA: hypothetical protein VLH94_00595 [Spirochaetia bacterium]|nr:hypothetical protein [Spirochaetia bacterium]